MIYFDFLSNTYAYLHVWVHTCPAKHMAAHPAHVTAPRIYRRFSLFLCFYILVWGA